MKKPPTGVPSAAAGGGSSGTSNDVLEKASREARELAEQLQQQMTQLEQSRITERQQLVEKFEQRDAQLKTINEKNAAVSRLIILILILIFKFSGSVLPNIL